MALCALSFFKKINNLPLGKNLQPNPASFSYFRFQLLLHKLHPICSRLTGNISEVNCGCVYMSGLPPLMCCSCFSHLMFSKCCEYSKGRLLPPVLIVYCYSDDGNSFPNDMFRRVEDVNKSTADIKVKRNNFYPVGFLNSPQY